MLVFLPETSASTILHHRTKRLQKASSNAHLVSQSSGIYTSLSITQAIQHALIKPFEITLKDPAIAFTNFYVRRARFASFSLASITNYQAPV